MTASVQGNKSKHTRCYKERYLIKTRQNKLQMKKKEERRRKIESKKERKKTGVRWVQTTPTILFQTSFPLQKKKEKTLWAKWNEHKRGPDDSGQ